MGKTVIGLLFGGESGEHEISVSSAAAVWRTLSRDRYEVVPIGIAQNGRWVTGTNARLSLEQADSGPLNEAAERMSASAPGKLPQALPAGIDIVFPLLHGPRGEDGTVQGLLELAGLPYVGAGVLASAVAMDKVAMKAALGHAGLPIVPYLMVTKSGWLTSPGTAVEAVASGPGFPCFVKPANLGSSLGVSRVGDQGELEGAIGHAALYDRRILVEMAVDAREIEASVLGNDDPVVSLPGEVTSAGDFYDYETKYRQGASQMRVPAEVPPERIKEIQGMALQAFKAIDGAGMARVDFFVDRSSGQLYVNEINTIPGFTETSYYPRLWEASGLPYQELLDRLIALGLERFTQKSELARTPQPKTRRAKPGSTEQADALFPVP